MNPEPTTRHDTLEYDPETSTYRADASREDEPPSRVVVEAIAAIEGRQPLDIDPLYERIDPLVLDALVSRGENERRTAATISFPYLCYDVRVRGSGLIEIRSQ